MTLSDPEWPFHASCAISAVAERFVIKLEKLSAQVAERWSMLSAVVKEKESERRISAKPEVELIFAIAIWQHNLLSWMTLNCPRPRSQNSGTKYLEYHEFR